MNKPMWIAQLYKEHIFASSRDRAVQGGLERHVAYGVNAQLHHLTERKDVRTRFYPALVSKTLIVGANISDAIQAHMLTL